MLLLILPLPVYLYSQAKVGWRDFGRHLSGAWWMLALSRRAGRVILGRQPGIRRARVLGLRLGPIVRGSGGARLLFLGAAQRLAYAGTRRPARIPIAPMANVLLPTIGSAGDVHPFIALGLALKARGHRATVLTNPYFQSSIESQGLEFLPVGSLADVERAVADADLWHPRKGFEAVARHAILPSIEAVYRLIESHADKDTVIAASSISFGGRIAQERLGLPMASIHLQPTVIRSYIDSGMFGDVRISARQPMWFKQALFRFIDWAAIDRVIGGPMNEFRARLGLAPVRRVLARWIHSPQCVIGFFPDWFAAPQADWPPQTHLVGFPLWDGGNGTAVAAGDGAGVSAGRPPPIVFTPGSAAAHAQRFFAESVAAVEALGARAMLVTNFSEQLPRELPPTVKAFGYLPFSEVLPHAAALVYHGGIGTLAQGINAAIPHLVVPNSHDQFDNGWRIAQLGLGRSIPERRYRAAGAAEALRVLLARCADATAMPRVLGSDGSGCRAHARLRADRSARTLNSRAPPVLPNSVTGYRRPRSSDTASARFLT